MNLVLIADVDNTLWDTDAVFSRAQKAALEVLRQCGFDLGPEGLKVLRAVDLHLAGSVGTFEYDFDDLMRALIVYAKGGDPELAAKLDRDDKHALSARESTVARRAATALRAILSEDVPRLLPGAQTLLRWLQDELRRPKRRVASFLVSEGDETRLLRTISHHGLDVAGLYFDGVRVLGSKTEESFQHIAEEGRALLGDKEAHVVCLGDSLRRDIAAGNAIGAITIYKPAGFLGDESPKSPVGTPLYRVENLFEALTLIKSIVGERA